MHTSSFTLIHCKMYTVYNVYIKCSPLLLSCTVHTMHALHAVNAILVLFALWSLCICVVSITQVAHIQSFHTLHCMRHIHWHIYAYTYLRYFYTWHHIFFKCEGSCCYLYACSIASMHAYMRKPAQMHACTHSYVLFWMHAYMQICTHTRTHMHTYVYISNSLYMHIFQAKAHLHCTRNCMHVAHFAYIIHVLFVHLYIWTYPCAFLRARTFWTATSIWTSGNWR